MRVLMDQFIRIVFLGIFMVNVQFSLLYSQTRQVKKKIEKAEQAKKKNNKKYNEARDKELKHRYDIQTPKTKERIDQAKKEAAVFNDKGKKRKSKKPKKY